MEALLANGKPVGAVLADETAWGGGVAIPRPAPAPKLILIRSVAGRCGEPAAGHDGPVTILTRPVRGRHLARMLADTLQSPLLPATRKMVPVPSGAPLHFRVLVAEDNPVNQMIAERMLAGLGAEVVVVASGREALERVEQERFDIVLMDCQMPEMDGFEATAAIRAREVELGGHLPIVALTASAMQEDRDRSMAAGMDDHLPKPVTAAALRATLVRWCRPADAPAAAAPSPAGLANA